ncbi:Hypothetical predicted protein [Olea europaea subsp. europaea]|uniref:Uncharacterized protein n=1 Tax=Olea europaea subsp. europaea TaxID=158383 RepID=A0A8S0U675_OLEEU|nr:Hypothetical predicted protein [Olea europaea subsp. europaea]
MIRTDSDKDLREFLSINMEKPHLSLWLANRLPHDHAVKKSPHLVHMTGPIAGFDGETGMPRLARSSGMRRDWSFEDPQQRIKG